MSTAMENTRKSEAIEQVLDVMEDLTKEELLEEIFKNIQNEPETPDNCNSV